VRGTDPGARATLTANSGSEHDFLEIRGQSTFSGKSLPANIDAATRAANVLIRMPTSIKTLSNSDALTPNFLENVL
jgi:hypothetical protein